MSLSYSEGVESRLKRWLIQFVERVSGASRLRRLYEQRHPHLEAGLGVWESTRLLLDLTLNYRGAAFEEIPATGPLLVVANHPYGLVDGVIVSHLLNHVRQDFKVLVLDVVEQIEEMKPWSLPIDFSGTPEARRINVKSRADAIELLKSGGAVVMFPGGHVSATGANVFGRAVDGKWQVFAAKMIHAAKANVLPVHVSGQNSWMFHLASRIGVWLRTGMLMRETCRLIGKTFDVTIGDPIAYDQLATIRDREELVAMLRTKTYALAEPTESGS